MKYKYTSLFGKYNIEPNIETGKLIATFQSDPSKRKDLPLVIQVLKNSKLLLEEELFTPHNDNNNILIAHKELLSSMVLLQDGIVIEELYGVDKAFHNFFGSVTKDTFFYAKTMSYKEYASLIDDFKKTVLDELYSKILIELENIDNEMLSWAFNFFSNNSEEYIEKLEDSISSKIELMCDAKDNDAIDANIGFLQTLPKSILERDNVYKSCLFFADKMMQKNKDIKMANKYYVPTMKLLKKSDADQYSNVLVDIVHDILDLEGKKKISYEHAKTETEQLVSNYFYFVTSVDFESSKLNKDEFTLCFNIICKMVFKGKTWWKKYYDSLSDLKYDANKDNIYDYVESVLSCGFSKNELKVFTNILIESSDFTKDLEEWGSHNDFLDYIVKTLKAERKIQIIRYYDITTIKEVNTPEFCDEFLCKYCVLSYLNSDLLNSKAIETIKSSAFCYLQFVDCGNEYLMNQGDYFSTYTRKGEYIRDVLRHCPADWKIGDETVTRVLSDKFGTTSVYGVSNYSIYKNKYDILFRNASYSQSGNIYLEKITNASKATHTYEEACALFDKGKYYDAYKKFSKLDDFSDAKEKAKLSYDAYAKEKYDLAMNYFNSEKYDEARATFEEIKDYRDSKMMAKKSLKMANEKIYNSAMELYNAKEYILAAKYFRLIPNYNDASALAEVCEKKYIEIQNEETYSSAMSLYKNKNYKEAQPMFKKLGGFKDSSEMYKKCEDAICEGNYANAMKLYSEAKYKDAMYLFDKKPKYKDSAAKSNDCKAKIKAIEQAESYEKAVGLLHAYEKYGGKNKLEEAASIFAKLANANYEDSQALLEECKKLLEKESEKQNRLAGAIFLAIAFVLTLIVIIACVNNC